MEFTELLINWPNKQFHAKAQRTQRFLGALADPFLGSHLRLSASPAIYSFRSLRALRLCVKLLLILSYLRLSDMHLGLLINFNVELLKNGIHRVVNQLAE
jgi:hypothetical protein